MIALLLGRFHALTRGQAELVASLVQEVNPDAAVDRIVCVITSADHSGTRRNPLDADTREALLRPVLMATGKPFDLVRVADIADDAAWVEHVRAAVRAQAGVVVEPASTMLVSANRDVQALFAAAGYRIAAASAGGLTPHELIQRIVDGKEWKSEAAPSTIEVFAARGVVGELQRIFGDKLRTDDGELSSHRDFVSYGAQMDASLVQKVEDLLPWVLPPRIVDKGCGTGKLLVELSRRFPGASLVGVDLSREFLRRSDENTYAGGDVELVLGDAADQQLPDGSADTVIFSSIMHEVYSYSGYVASAVDRALASAARELRRGGRLLIRDGISPDPRDVAPRSNGRRHGRADFERFAREFKHGQGAAFTARDARRRRRHRATQRTPGQRVLVQEGLPQELAHRGARGVRRVHRRRWRAALAATYFRSDDNDVREPMDPTKSISGSRQRDGAERHLLLAGDERGHYRGTTVTPSGIMGVAVDLAIFTVQEARLELLLIRMKREPFTGKWALPGGRIRGDETVEQAAARELHEKAGSRDVYLEQLYTFSEPSRDPGRALHLGRAPGADSRRRAVAYDRQILRHRLVSRRRACRRWPSTTTRSPSYAVERLRAKLEYTDVARNLLDSTFTLGELQRLYEAILGKRLDARNFQRRAAADRAGQRHGHGCAPGRPTARRACSGSLDADLLSVLQ